MDMPRRAIPSVAGLLAFEATARYLSFSRAADHLCLSQGAVSKRVRQLEEVVGVPLLARTRHQVHLTEMGRAYLVRVRNLLEELEAATQSLRIEAPNRQTIVVAAPLSFSVRWLMPRLRRYHERHPELRIDLLTANEGTRLNPEMGIDCLVHARRPQERDTLSLSLPDTLWVTVATPAYRDRHSIASSADIARLTRIVQSDMAGLWRGWLTRAGLDQIDDDGALLHVEGLELAIAAAMAGNGIALAPRHLIEAELRSHELAIVGDEIAVMEKGHQVSIPAHLACDGVLSSFVDWVCSEFTGDRPASHAA